MCHARPGLRNTQTMFKSSTSETNRGLVEAVVDFATEGKGKRRQGYQDLVPTLDLSSYSPIRTPALLEESARARSTSDATSSNVSRPDLPVAVELRGSVGAAMAGRFGLHSRSTPFYCRGSASIERPMGGSVSINQLRGTKLRQRRSPQPYLYACPAPKLVYTYHDIQKQRFPRSYSPRTPIADQVQMLPWRVTL